MANKKLTKKKVNKSVSLNSDVYDRLVLVCERLGVNVNAYLVNAVGQQLQRDEAPLKAQESAISSMMSIFTEQLNSPEFDAEAKSIAEGMVQGLIENKKP